MAQLLTIQIGEPQSLPADPSNPLATKAWSTGFFKTAIAEPVSVQPMGIDGDGQADLKNHGGIDKAICVYASEHQPAWAQFLGIDQFPNGGFGENFTVAGLLETDVCIGDIYQIGEVILQVSQPRQPCWKLARRWNKKQLTPEVKRTGKTGWYFRVMQPGTVASPASIELLERGGDEGKWTIALANKIISDQETNPELVQALAAFPPLSNGWKRQLERK